MASSEIPAPAGADNSGRPTAVILPFRRPDEKPETVLIDFEPCHPDMSIDDYLRAWRLMVVTAREAKAWRDFVEAKWSRLRVSIGEEANAVMSEERHFAFKIMQAHIHAVAVAPVPLADRPADMALHIRTKRDVIGRVWLGAEGRNFDRYRACLAEDESRLFQRREQQRRNRKRSAAA